ncbi:CehA/McbA family metallohydrolase [Massilia sp. LXY-6]|uniref:CehA/McbA family metallohydrolase n=1 Tax=Massilia sp. LXY-6 TaxID=3379823 RepID=UPI003EE3C8E0
MRLFFLIPLLLACAGSAIAADTAAPDLVLHGSLSGADHQTYRKVPFTVPAGVQRITIEFDYTGREQRSVIDLGLLGPGGELRGWSGGNKSVLTISSTDATPSYQPTPPAAGQWALLLGIPNMRPNGHADYTAKVYFSHGLAAADEPALLRAPLRTGAAWYRGDLHMHTGHSDGSCATASGKGSAPCPLFLTAVAARARKLDFIAITEHNTVSHANAIRELQPYFDDLLLMPGREVTTFFGHANLFGTLAPLDFRIGTGTGRDANTLLRDAAALHGLVSINHPVRPSGEQCMGCGWEQPTDMRLVQAIEAVNGGDADTRWSGIPFWTSQLRHGLRITAIGGSDNHHADRSEGPPGAPTTVVYARALSQLAVLEAIRAGHVFVDVAGSADRLLELSAQAGEERAMMGDALAAPAGMPVRFDVHVAHAAGARIEVLVDGTPAALLAQAGVGSEDWHRGFAWRSDGNPHWLRVEVRDGQGKLLLLGNPIYMNRR